MTCKIKFMYPELMFGSRVIIVGNSANLVGKGMGHFVDEFDEVVRFNRAPTSGFEEHVGSKTTLRITNNHVFKSQPFTRWEISEDEQNFVKNLRDTRVALYSPTPTFMEIYDERDHYIDPSCEAYYVEYVELSEAVTAFGLEKLPSSGLCFTYACISSGLVPHLMGFGVGEAQMSHYWEPRDDNTPYHNFDVERRLLLKWANDGLIALHV